MAMKSFPLFFLWSLLLLTGCQHRGAQRTHVFIETVTMKHRTDDSFKGIVEALTGKESFGGRVLLRTDPQQRSGLYFTVVFGNTLTPIPEGSRIVLTFITDYSPKPVSYTWTFPKVKHTLLFQNELYLGVTGVPEMNASRSLIAWKIDIFAPDGHRLATRHSYAW